VPYSRGGPDCPWAALSDAVAYGAPQPHRPSLARVVDEVVACVRASDAAEARRARA
jgi:hypothetical protein